MTLKAGMHLGPYEILAPLGAGGMGEVYRAQDSRLRREVAIKVLPKELAEDRSALRRFEREAKALAALSHPNIMAIHDVGREPGFSFVVTELLEGETLHERLRGAARTPGYHGGQPLPWRKAVEIGAAIADGLAAAHARGIVHRDLKPGNIFLTSDGVVKILDFGLARMISEPAWKDQAEMPTVTATTQPGAVMGTPAYMSPEQTRGELTDAHSDIFSFGCVLYEMVTGDCPFSGDTPAELIAAILKDEPREISETGQTVPPELEHIVRHCLEKKPEDRFQSARDLAFDLRALVSVRPPRSRVLLWIAAVCVAITALAALFISLRQADWSSRGLQPARTLVPSRIDSLVVLPLENLSGDPEQEYFVDGMTDALIANLGQISALRVISRTSAMHFKGTDKSIPEIARQLGVDAAVEGSVVRAGNRVRITAQLIHGATDSHLWAHSYERELRDILTLQSEVARAIAKEVHAALKPSERAQLADQRQVDAEAYQLYLKGRYFWNKRTEAGFYKAIDYFQQAIDRDPSCALAYAGLSDAYICLANYVIVQPKEAYTKAEVAAMKALEIDDTLAEAYTSLGEIKSERDWDWSGAEREHRRAIRLNPGYATARQWYAGFLSTLGRSQEAVVEIRRAQELDPLSPIIHMNAGFIFYEARQHAQAAEECRKALELAPDFAVAHWGLGLIYGQMGKHAEAIAEAERAMELTGNAVQNVAFLGCAYALAGRDEQARQILAELDRRSQMSYVPPYLFGIIYTGLGEKDEAFRWLERAYEDRDPALIDAGGEPLLDPLREDPRFDDLLRRMGLDPSAYPKPQVPKPPAGKIMLAVLPFENLSGDPEQDYFSDGMTAEVITKLSQLAPEKISVIGRASAMHFKGSAATVSEIGRQLRADYIVHGSVRRAGRRVRIAVELVDVRDQANQWADRFDREVNDLLALQSDVAGLVSRALALELLPQPPAPKVDPAAHAAYLRGRYHYWQFTREDAPKAVDQFERAIELEPTFAPAHAGLANALVLDAGYNQRVESLPAAKTAALRAVSLDPSLAEAHAAVGFISSLCDYDWSTAEARLQRALALNPSSTEALYSYAMYLLVHRRFDESIATMRRAVQLDPFNLALRSTVGDVLTAARRYDEAITELLETLELDTDFYDTLRGLRWAYQQRGDYEQAIVFYGRAFQLSPEEVTSFREAYRSRGRAGYFQWLRDHSLQRIEKGRRKAIYYLAECCAELGDYDTALEWLERAYADRNPSVILVNADPAFDSLRDNPRFQDLLRHLGFEPDAEPTSDAKPPSGKIMLAVLPFANLGPAEEEYFADGISDEIRSRLAKVRQLGVISRASAFQYKQDRKSNKQIGAELGVDYVIDGTVRWDRRAEGASRVRVTPELIRISDDTQLWSQPYNRELADIFEVQSDIAEQVIKQLNVTLLEPERQAIEVRPTENVEAYNAYLRGLHYLERPDHSAADLRLAEQMLKRAVALDPDFALAYADLSRSHSGMFHFSHDRTEPRTDKAKAAADKALELQSELPEAHLALGYYHYWCHRDYERALEAIAVAEKGLPNDSRLLSALGSIRRRQGRFEVALDNFKRAFELSPRDANIALDMASIHRILQRYMEADRCFDQAIALAPDQLTAYWQKAGNHLLWRGDTANARAALRAMPRKNGEAALLAGFRLTLLERDYRVALDQLKCPSAESLGDYIWIFPKSQLAGLAYLLNGEPALAHASYDSARLLLEERLRQEPDDYDARSLLGIVYAALGYKEKAIGHGKSAVESCPISKDALDSPRLLMDLAFVYVLVGDHTAALDQIEYVLSIPQDQLSVPLLRLDPRWNPLRDHPRYKELLRQHGFEPEAQPVTGAKPPTHKIMLAVLPFEDLSPEPAEWFSDGMTEEMIAQLGRLQPKKLGVIARTSAMRFKDTDQSIGEIGHQLGVDYILEGSVRRAGDRLRITASLVHVSDETTRWGHEYDDRSVADVFDVQADVAQSIANSLALELLPNEQARLASPRQVDPEAYEAYLKGRFHWNKRTEEGFYQAIECFNRAIAADPRCAPAYAGLADAHILQAVWAIVLPSEAFPKAKAAALQAIQIDDTLAEAHASLAAMQAYEWNWSETEKEFKRAIELNPGYATAHQWYALTLSSLGRHAEAIAEAQRALECDPLSLMIRTDTGSVYYFARQYDQSIAACRETLQMDPHFEAAYAHLAGAYA